MQRLLFFTGFILSFFIGFAQVQIPAASKQIMDYPNAGSQSYVAKVNASFKESEITDLGGTIGSRIADIVTIHFNNAPHNQLKNLTGVVYLQIANKITPRLSRVIPDLRADSVQRGDGLIRGYTGKDVIIGITDWGFDYTHPMFYDTALQHTRILAAWDQFKRSGPAPDGFNYGTMYEGEAELFAAQKDTINIYGYATHGSHVAGIAGGSGAGTQHRGVAYEANYLMVTFLADEAAVIDAFSWMKAKAKEYGKRLVINMSWGLYNLGPLDGTSLVSQAIDQMSSEGVIFVTSGGNNGDETFHIKKTFANDTVSSLVEFYSYASNANMWGQSISMWGEEGKTFGTGFSVYDNFKKVLVASPLYDLARTSGYVDSFMLVGVDTVFYNVQMDSTHPLNNKPHVRLRIKNTNTALKIGLKVYGSDGTIHIYNVTELTTDVGNWGMPLSAYLPGWTAGDNQYSLGEPASTESVITVAAHTSEFYFSGNSYGGTIAPFSSFGPTIDGRMKPDVSAPGVNVASSISSFTNNTYTLLQNVNFKGKNYPFARFSGTSMSSPATAGVVALMLQANPFLSAENTKAILHGTAREDKSTGDLSETGDTQWGWGKVNAYEAVRLSETTCVRNPNGIEVQALCLYPNPANSHLYINSAKIENVSVYAMDGKCVLKGVMGQNSPLNIATLTDGVYMLHFDDARRAPLRFLVLLH
jgi:minor extracellular serine protease Vpr